MIAPLFRFSHSRIPDDVQRAAGHSVRGAPSRLVALSKSRMGIKSIFYDMLSISDYIPCFPTYLLEFIDAVDALLNICIWTVCLRNWYLIHFDKMGHVSHFWVFFCSFSWRKPKRKISLRSRHPWVDFHAFKRPFLQRLLVQAHFMDLFFRCSSVISDFFMFFVSDASQSALIFLLL